MTKDSVTPPTSVLVVEGSAEIRRLFEVVLRDVAHPLFVVADEEKAREILATESIDAVVLEPHGLYGLCWGLLDDLAAAALPTIVVTSRADARVEREAIRRGAVAFVAKPFIPADLLAIIHDIRFANDV